MSKLLHFFAPGYFPLPSGRVGEIFAFSGQKSNSSPASGAGSSDKILTLSGYPFMGRGLLLPKITKSLKMQKFAGCQRRVT